jgi:hypothetical protein
MIGSRVIVWMKLGITPIFSLIQLPCQNSRLKEAPQEFFGESSASKMLSDDKGTILCETPRWDISLMTRMIIQQQVSLN